MLSMLNPAWREFSDEMERTGSQPRTNPDGDPCSDSDTSEDSSVPSRAPTPMLDPSTNPNPLDALNAHEEHDNDDMEDRAWKAPDKKKKKPKDDDEEEDDKDGSEVEDEAESSQTIASRGSILVTLRNVEPYTSW